MTECTLCGRLLSNDSFYPSSPTRCRECRKAAHQRWVENNRERNREIGRDSARRHRVEKQAQSRAYYAANRERLLAAERARNLRQKVHRQARAVALYAELKEAAFAAYGSRCACCGEEQRAFLQFDHVADDGYEHRKTISPGSTFYRWLRKNGYPPSIQILCANCNQGKRLNRGVCPHQVDQMKACHGIEIREL